MLIKVKVRATTGEIGITAVVIRFSACILTLFQTLTGKEASNQKYNAIHFSTLRCNATNRIYRSMPDKGARLYK